MFKDDKRNKKIRVHHPTIHFSVVKKKSPSRPSLCDYFEEEKQKKKFNFCAL